ncbi:putative translation initiation factor eIF-2B subunit delta [Venturia inaequalis]|nr:putative translation initiation factor eIF-2B subunit delta [Venturia inaequalis]
MNQDDRVETGYYVRNMDNFYRGAEDVLIWVGLGNAESELAIFGTDFVTEPRCVDYGERRSPPVEDISWWHYANSLNGRGFNGPGAFGPCIWARQGVDPAFGIALVGGAATMEPPTSQEPPTFQSRLGRSANTHFAPEINTE